VLLLDEILAVGDASFRAQCRDNFRTLRRDGHSILLVSHQPSHVAELCDRALLLDQGRIVGVGSGEEVAEAYVALLQERPCEGGGDQSVSMTQGCSRR
jgi:ABC-type polysaccharide/polyol phosphate transport system ATPase subunit